MDTVAASRNQIGGIKLDVHLDIHLDAHLAVIDVLAIGVAQKKGPQLDAHLQKLQAGLASLRSQ